MSLDPSRISAPVRRVSSRQLGRNVAELLNEVEREGNSLLIIRYGRPSALLSPVGDELAVRSPVPPPEEYAEEIAELSEVQRSILLKLSDGYPHADPIKDLCEQGEGLSALAGLEIKQLISRSNWDGYTISRLGARVARALAAEQSERI